MSANHFARHTDCLVNGNKLHLAVHDGCFFQHEHAEDALTMEYDGDVVTCYGLRSFKHGQAACCNHFLRRDAKHSRNDMMFSKMHRCMRKCATFELSSATSCVHTERIVCEVMKILSSTRLCSDNRFISTTCTHDSVSCCWFTCRILRQNAMSANLVAVTGRRKKCV